MEKFVDEWVATKKKGKERKWKHNQTLLIELLAKTSPKNAHDTVWARFHYHSYHKMRCVEVINNTWAYCNAIINKKKEAKLYESAKPSSPKSPSS